MSAENSSKYDAVIRAINMSMLRCDIPVFKYTKIDYCTILLIQGIKNNLLILIIEKTQILLALHPILHRPTIYIKTLRCDA